jgi:hypothetical protein
MLLFTLDSAQWIARNSLSTLIIIMGVRAICFIICVRPVPQLRPRVSGGGGILFYSAQRAWGRGCFRNRCSQCREKLHYIRANVRLCGLVCPLVMRVMDFHSVAAFTKTRICPSVHCICVCGKWWAKWKTDCCATTQPWLYYICVIYSLPCVHTFPYYEKRNYTVTKRWKAQKAMWFL